MIQLTLDSSPVDVGHQRNIKGRGMDWNAICTHPRSDSANAAIRERKDTIRTFHLLGIGYNIQNGLRKCLVRCCRVNSQLFT